MKISSASFQAIDATFGQDDSQAYRGETGAPWLPLPPAIEVNSSAWPEPETPLTAGPGMHLKPTDRWLNWFITTAVFHVRTAGWRVPACLLAGSCGILLLIGALLSPRPEGYGTHEQLGLQPCGIMERYHLPCPACGLTTSVSAMEHGQFRLAWRAHPFGPFLFAGLVLAGLAAIAELAGGHNLLKWLGPFNWWFWSLVGGVLLGWCIRLATGLADGTLPVLGKGIT